MQMRRLKRRDKVLLTSLSAEQWREVPAGTEMSSIKNLEAHKLAISSRIMNERGRWVSIMKQTASGAETAAAILKAINRHRGSGNSWVARSEPESTPRNE